MTSLSANYTQDRQMATRTPAKVKPKAGGNVMPNARFGQPEVARLQASREDQTGRACDAANRLSMLAGLVPEAKLAGLLLLRLQESDPTRPSPTYQFIFAIGVTH